MEILTQSGTCIDVLLYGKILIASLKLPGRFVKQLAESNRFIQRLSSDIF